MAQAQGKPRAVHSCVLMWQGSDSEQSWLSPWSRGCGSNSQLPSLSLLPSLAPSGLWSSLLSCSCQSLGCWALLTQTGISLRRQSLPSVKLQRVFTSCCHCLSLILMGYFMVLAGWDGLKAEPLIPTVPQLLRGAAFQDREEGSSTPYLPDTVPSHRSRWYQVSKGPAMISLSFHKQLQLLRAACLGRARPALPPSGRASLDESTSLYRAGFLPHLFPLREGAHIQVEEEGGRNSKSGRRSSTKGLWFPVNKINYSGLCLHLLFCS